MSFLVNKAFQTGANVYRKTSCSGKARPLFSGEKHIGCHNFSGPGTRIDLPEVLNFKPYNNIDACSRQHDIDYNNTKGLSGIERQRAIRKADEVVLNCYDKFPNDSGYSLAKAGIKGKMVAENVAPSLVKAVAGEEYQGGKGKKKATKKPNKWMIHVNKVKKANPGLSYKEVLIKAKTSYHN